MTIFQNWWMYPDLRYERKGSYESFILDIIQPMSIKNEFPEAHELSTGFCRSKFEEKMLIWVSRNMCC